MSKPVPKPRTRTLTRSGELPSSPPTGRNGEEGSGSPRSPKEAWVDSSKGTEVDIPPPVSDANKMYTDDDEDEDFMDSLEFHNPEDSAEWSAGGIGGCQSSRFHPVDTLKNFTSQAPFASQASPTTPRRTSPTSKLNQEESKLLLREVTDLKNHKISLTQEISALSSELMTKREELEELELRLQSREKGLRDREQLNAVEKGNIDLKWKKIALKEKELGERENTLLRRQHALDERETLLAEQEAAASGNKKDALRVAEEEIKKKDASLHEWSRSLHEEAERLRLKEIEQDREFQNRLAALSILEEESHQLQGGHSEELVDAAPKPSRVATAPAVVDPKVKEDADLAARLQQELWQVGVSLSPTFPVQSHFVVAVLAQVLPTCSVCMAAHIMVDYCSV